MTESALALRGGQAWIARKPPASTIARVMASACPACVRVARTTLVRIARSEGARTTARVMECATMASADAFRPGQELIAQLNNVHSIAEDAANAKT